MIGSMCVVHACNISGRLRGRLLRRPAAGLLHEWPGREADRRDSRGCFVCSVGSYRTWTYISRYTSVRHQFRRGLLIGNQLKRQRSRWIECRRSRSALNNVILYRVSFLHSLRWTCVANERIRKQNCTDDVTLMRNMFIMIYKLKVTYRRCCTEVIPF